MSAPCTPAVEALIDACAAGLAKSEFLYRDDWPDVGRVVREQVRERVIAVLIATGIPLDVLADMAAGNHAAVDQTAPAVERQVTVIEAVAGPGKSWWWWK